MGTGFPPEPVLGPAKGRTRVRSPLRRVKEGRTRSCGKQNLHPLGFPAAGASAARADAVPGTGARAFRQAAGAVGALVTDLDADIDRTVACDRAGHVDIGAALIADL